MADGKAAREARLAAALRENLKRRKAASRPLGDHADEAMDGLGLPEGLAPLGGGAAEADDAKGRGTGGTAAGTTDKV